MIRLRQDMFLTFWVASLCVHSILGEERPARDVPWLAEVQQAPVPMPALSRPIAPLLVAPSGEPIQSPAEWQDVRSAIHEQWLQFLGPMPKDRPTSRFEVVREERIDGGVRQLVRYLSEADETVEGYLLKPLDSSLRDSTQRLPAIVALHQTSNANIEEIAGVANGEPQDLGVQLCRAGFVVFCPRCYLWQTPPKFEIDVKTTVARFHGRHPRTLGMHKMLFDAQRAIDLLQAIPDVNPNRIGATGHSLGGKETLYLTAFDDRVKAAVASEGGIELSSSNWHDPWYLGSGIREPNFKRDHHELLAMIAPRPFLVVGGETGPGAVDGTRSWPYIKAALDVYGLYGRPARLGLLNHGQGHTMPSDVRRRIIEWLTVYLN